MRTLIFLLIIVLGIITGVFVGRAVAFAAHPDASDVRGTYAAIEARIPYIWGGIAGGAVLGFVGCAIYSHKFPQRS